MNRFAALGFCACLLAAGCHKKAKIPVPPPPAPGLGTAPGSGTSRRPSRPAAVAPPVGSVETGVASWYGKPYHGRQAADGEIYDMETMVAAHRTLPFQTMVRVRNVKNDKTVDVRIIDRGPFVNGRIIDLSHAAARAIDLIGPGVGPVELTILSTPSSGSPAAEGLFGVQVGVFRERANADRMQERMAKEYGSAKEALRAGDPPSWRIVAGAEPTEEAAEELAQKIRREQGVRLAFVVRLDQ
jgi:rare lipoprotein A